MLSQSAGGDCSPHDAMPPAELRSCIAPGERAADAGTDRDGGPDSPRETAPRRAPRSSRLLAGEMRSARGQAASVRVRNLSAGGMGGKADIAVAPGDAIALVLPGIGPVSGRIAWVRGDQFGVTFDRAVDPGLARFVAPAPVKSGYIAPSSHRPTADCRRPGLRTR